MAVLCYQIFRLSRLMVWAILAVTLYPAHQKLAADGGKQGLAATVLVLIGLVLIGCRRVC